MPAGHSCCRKRRGYQVFGLYRRNRILICPVASIPYSQETFGRTPCLDSPRWMSRFSVFLIILMTFHSKPEMRGMFKLAFLQEKSDDFSKVVVFGVKEFLRLHNTCYDLKEQIHIFSEHHKVLDLINYSWFYVDLKPFSGKHQYTCRNWELFRKDVFFVAYSFLHFFF